MSSFSTRPSAPFPIVLVLCCLLCPPAHAIDSGTNPSSVFNTDSTQYDARTWTTEEGLPQNSIWALEQGRDGHLWIGTLEGLARFDGHTFTTFDAASSKGLAGNGIHALLQGSDGTLWIGTTGGLSVRHDGQFRRMEGSPVVYEIDEGSDGSVWLGTEDGLYRSAEEGIAPVSLPDTLAQTEIRNITTVGPDSLWLENNGHLYLHHEGTVDHPHKASRICGSVDGVDSSPDGTLWVDTGTAFVSVNEEGMTSFDHDESGIQETWTPSSSVVWAATKHKGLLRRTDSTLRHVNPDGAIPDLLTDLIRDDSGQWWIGTYNQGLIRVRPSLFRRVTSGPAAQSAIHGVYASPQGDLWAGTFANGLLHVTGSRARESLPDADLVWTIAEDASETLWIAAEEELYRQSGTQFDPVRTSDEASFSSTRVLYQDSTETLWIPQNQGGLYRYRQDTLTRVLSPDQLSARVLTLHRARDGALWIGTRRLGLARYQNDSLTWYGPEDGLPYQNVRHVHETRDGTLWVTTYGGGLARYEGDHFTPVTPEDGLPAGTIHSIHESPEDLFWMTSNEGVFQVPRRQLEAVADGQQDRIYARTFGPEDGMPVRECNGNFQPAIAEDEDGRLWIPTMEGLTTVDPSEASSTVPETMPIRVTGVRVAEQSRPLDSLHLSPSPRRVAIAFTAVSLRRADDLFFRYRLDDGPWTPARGHRTAEYTNLEAGTHQFEVQATLDGETWYSLEAPLHFTVAPHFYETWWFRALLGLGLLGLLGGGYLLRIRVLRHREEELRRMVNVRTAELTEEKKKTEDQARRLETLDAEKNRFFANVSHELRTPLTLIAGPLHDALEGAYGTVPEPLRVQLRRMHRNAERLEQLIDQLLDLSTLETEGLQLDRTRADLVPFLEALVDAFAPLAERNEITLQFRPHLEEQALDVDSDKLEKVFDNLLSNALKFTPEGGSVLVTADVQGEVSPALRVSIHDTGPGIPEDQQAHLFERFYQGDETGATGGTGIGLALASEIVELHGGSIEATSREGEGSTFTVSLPLPDDVVPGEGVDHGREAEEILRQGDGTLRSSALLPPEEGEPFSASDLSNAAPADAPLVLIVEDNPDVRAHLRRHLRDAYRLVEAPDGPAGLEAAHEHEPDLILLDVMLPDTDGMAVCRALREDAAFGAVPIVMLTARAGEDDTTRGLTAGADAYLTKPFSMTTLRAHIERLLDARSALRERADSAVLTPDVDTTPDDETFLENVAESIESHLGRSGFTVDDLAANVGLSPRQLRRRLKDLTGRPPSEIIRTYRLEYAAQLLEAETGTISEIAYRVGFGTLDTFSKHFEDQFGCAPSAYPSEATDEAPTDSDGIPTPEPLDSSDPAESGE